MNPDDTAILHPGSYSFRSTVAKLVTRAVAVNDVPQRTYLDAYLTTIRAAAVAGNLLQASEMAQDTAGHGGRHLNKDSSHILYRSTEDADIKTDTLAICDAAILLL